MTLQILPRAIRSIGANGPKERQFLGAGFADSLGTGVFLVIAPVVAATELGQAVTTIGLAYTVGGAAAIAGSVPLARLSDRIGPVRFLVFLHLLRFLVVLIFPFAYNPFAYVIVVAVLAGLDGPVGSLHQAISAGLRGKLDAVRLLAGMRTVRNIGFAVGSLGAAAILFLPAGAAFAGSLFNASSFLAAAILLWPLTKSVVAPSARRQQEAVLRRIRGVFAQRRLWMGVFSGLLSVHATLLTFGVAIWVSQSDVVPPSAVGLAVFANAVVVILLQVPVTIWWEKYVAQFWLPALALAVTFSALWLGLRWETAAFVALGFAVICVTAAELTHSVASWSAAARLARPHTISSDIATFNLGQQVQEMLAPLAIAWLIIYGTNLIWGVVIVVFIVCGLMLDFFAKREGVED